MPKTLTPNTSEKTAKKEKKEIDPLHEFKKKTRQYLKDVKEVREVCARLKPVIAEDTASLDSFK